MAEDGARPTSTILQLGSGVIALVVTVVAIFLPWWTLEIDTTTGQGTKHATLEARPFDQGAFQGTSSDDLASEVTTTGNLYGLALVGLFGLLAVDFMRSRGRPLPQAWSLAAVIVCVAGGLAAVLHAMNAWPPGYDATEVRKMGFWGTSTGGITGGTVTHTSSAAPGWYVAMAGSLALPLVPLVVGFVNRRIDRTPTL